jgi:cellobiose phosphorylase
MLRIALIEDLRRIGVRIAAARDAHNLADGWADTMLDVAARDPKNLILVIADMARSDPPTSGPFVAELARRLKGRSAALALPLTWIEQRLAESHQGIEQVVQAEAQDQASAQVSVSNCIGSLRLLSATDWREFVETLSIVERTLREDPSGVYARMDFHTRDEYRHAVERLARRSRRSEAEVARAAVDLAAAAAAGAGGTDGATPHSSPRDHVGHYLVGKGVEQLERAVQARRSLSQRLRRAAASRALLLYCGSIVMLSLLFSAGTVGWAALARDSASLGVRFGAVLLPIGLVLLLASSQLAIGLVNRAASLFRRPRTLPRMDFSSGIPNASRTLVVVPTMLTREPDIDELVEGLEVRFLANRDPQLYFGLLTDFRDSREEIAPDDEILLRAAHDRIVALNRKYNPPGAGVRAGDRFFLLHRPRRWNERDRIWMGHERKRGKLADLNALLRGRAAAGPGERFSSIVGDVSQLRSVRYVITLDTDTQLPRDAGWQLVATMAHPLNRPRLGGTRDAPIVVDGYGILQPRVGVSLSSANRSAYARLFCGDPGIDPYTRAVSDVYQDLFDEGSFIGKGIYDVDAFEHVLGDRLPDNRILSHDLLEGCFARSGLVSDVQLFETSPSRHDADVKRRYRWIRGDWQIIGWLMPAIRIRRDTRDGARAAWVANPLSALSRFKIFDNLRRSLTPVALTAWFVLGWTVLQPAWIWTLAGLAILFVPTLLGLVAELLRKPGALRSRQYVAAAAPSVLRQFGQSLLGLVFLPYEAMFSLDAAARTVARLWITDRRLLEWQSSADVARDGRIDPFPDLIRTTRRMGFASVLALLIAAGLRTWRPLSLVAAAPVLLLWSLSPVVSWWISRPHRRRPAALRPEQVTFLRALARRTWAFFEDHVGAVDRHLPPDNVQEHPIARVAHRTSPTNMGLSLLATLTAYDLGFITLGQLIERTRASLDTMEGMERYQTHFYNWYDTQTLQPLRPRYVSTVDSGNLSGHLLTLCAGLRGLADEGARWSRLLDGMRDTHQLLQSVTGKEIQTPLRRFATLLESAQSSPRESPAELERIYAPLARCSAQIVAAEASADFSVPTGDPAGLAETRRWALALDAQCRAAVDELRILAPGSGQAGIAADTAWSASAPLIRRDALLALAERAGSLARMDFGFLFDPARKLMTIGFNVDERRRDSGSYDLLASEARLCTFVAIAQGQVSQESWFALGRTLTAAGGDPVLLSWSGSMFEYLMPLLVMPTYENTLLHQTAHAAVVRQIEYGRQRDVPWGISESGYHTIDAALNYQYGAFGVPGLGLKRGLSEDLVVAPYATALALMIDPKAALQNLHRLVDEGLAGTYGFYEAIDYTPARVLRGQAGAIVRQFMAHHQAMTLLSLSHVLLDRPMQRRFEADAELQATLLLLQERIPKRVAIHSHAGDRADLRRTMDVAETPLRVIHAPDTPAPDVQLLSNGRYHVMLTNAGGGYSRWKEIAVTRWSEDSTCDSWGTFCYLRDLGSDTLWSATHQPTRSRADSFEAIFSEGRAEFRRRDHGIEAYTEIVVSPEDDIELRRLRLTNLGRSRRTIEVTSYAEVVLAPAAADLHHPAFSKLFVQTELLGDAPALLCTRRPRSPEEPAPWMFHLMAVHGAEASTASHETDRARFIGRGRSLAAPRALRERGPLSGTSGSVLDPVAATRRVITLEPEQTATIDMVYGVADARDGCLALLAKYGDRRLADRVFELAWTHSQVVLRQLNASESEAQIYARLASAVVYSQPGLRADASVILGNRRGQSGLWGYAISGDLPIVLLQVGDGANIDLVRQMVQAHAWWRLKGLAVDLVIWNEERDVYRQRLQEQILGLIASGAEASVVDRPGGIFVRHADQISVEDRALLQAVSRAVLTDRAGTLMEQVSRTPGAERRVGPFVATRAVGAAPSRPWRAATRGLRFFNGTGGFTSDGREYVVAPQSGRRPPAPWVNVIANPRFGTVISEAGTSYTWCENAHELRITPWHNDPVCDSGGEVLYLRDEETGEVWHPTSLPSPGDLRDAPEPSGYVTRHGFGYSVFEHDQCGIRSELTVFVAMDAAVKFSVLKLVNRGTRSRRLSATGYVEWVLGHLREKSAPHVTTLLAPGTGAIHARNAYSSDFGDWVGFFDTDGIDRPVGTVTCDRTEFIGRNGSLSRPAALSRSCLSGRTGATIDPCAAIQVPFDLPAGETREIVFRLGMGRSTDEAEQLVRRFRGNAAAHEALKAVHEHWQTTLGAVQVRTPDEAVDVLTNGWLVYQTLCCRMWARSGFHQSGGAYGFRDQLQDAMALVHSRPRLLREHLLLSASRQFVDGDVQHWWHPPVGRGVRTRVSDDYLWLPLALCRYVQATHDTGVLTEDVPFLDGRPVNTNDESYFDLPARSIHSASLYHHAVRALMHGLRFGRHGLPLMGGGDWNDGMNRVGRGGEGESVWLGFFLCDLLRQFSDLARGHGDEAVAERCRDERARLGRNLEAQAWDGGWYLRAYFDDGTPLGSKDNDECQIDSIAQSWAVLSGVADPTRARRAMDATATRLVRAEDGLVKLLDPPFDHKGPDPGYISGYVPGVRENGGQYTHGAIWAAMAFAALGDAPRAWEVMNIINPIHHGRTAREVSRYKVEPYVVAADVYSVAPHVGRGGWSWYTASSGWMYRLVLESLLGLRLETTERGSLLHIEPCLPDDWPGFTVDYRYRDTPYRLRISRDGEAGATTQVVLDGAVLVGGVVPLVDDRKTHEALVTLASLVVPSAAVPPAPN